MALILSLREGDDFYVNDERAVIRKVDTANDFTVEVEKTGKRYRITDQESQEVFDNVFISSGDFRCAGQVRLVIDAPRSVLILRGDKYRTDPSAYYGRD